ncbi:MAG: 4-alpha-glucanotransferase [Myxococcaceae bacterium]|nr:4-alpha-glucanotransferase [Myxococcaceae bacterium]
MLPFGRLSGILQPLFSFRAEGDSGVGDFAALDPFFAWMQRAQQRMLMVLPLLPTTPGDPSPYSTRSAFGLNPLFIHLEWLPEGVTWTDAEQQQLAVARASPTIRYDLVFPLKTAALERAFAVFEKSGASARRSSFDRFCMEQDFWLTNYALYSAVSEAFSAKPWWEWPKGLATRDPQALEVARKEHQKRIRFHQYLQWVCDEQWQRVRQQAKARGVLLCGDEPFIIGQDSADCWANQKYLRRDARLGVPPDDFSADGQDWGLPWFDFEAMERDGDVWIKARAKAAAATYDTRRIDHAIGYFRQYIRDAQTPKGRFVPADQPSQEHRGERNFRLLSAGTSIVAEDLGVIPRFARDTLAKLGLPGYQVMRWSREDGIYRDPRHYPEVSLVTTGTHDTETMRAWWEGAQPWERETVCRVWPELWRFNPPPATFGPEVHEALLQAALNAQSAWCILPWSDVFAEAERVNTPGTVGPHNWSYRMKPTVESLLTRDDTVRTAAWLARLTREGRRA